MARDLLADRLDPTHHPLADRPGDRTVIDFRYHLVSLISVFLALAVGIVLGAGPLQGPIGDALTGEVEDLRTRAADLRAELDRTSAELAAAEQGVDEIAPSLLDGVLPGHRVALVTVGEVTPEVQAEVVQRLGETGAVVTAQAQLTDVWTDPGQQSFRAALAGTLLDHMDPVPADDAGTGTELAEGLVQGLTTASPTNPDEVADRAGNLLALLSEAELVVLTDDVLTAADHVVVLAGPTVTAEQAAVEQTAEAAAPDDEQRAAAEEAERRVSAATEVVRAARARAGGVVAVGGPVQTPGLVAEVRGADDLEVTTVDSVASATGGVAVPLALANDVVGAPDHYGTGPGATRVLPSRVTVPPIERVVVDPEVPAGDEGAGGEDTGADGAADADAGDGTDEGDGGTTEGE